MKSHSSPDRSSGIDPLLRPAGSAGNTSRSGPTSHSAPVETTARRDGRRPPKRRHPARGARALALGASVVATGAVATGLAYSEGAWSAADSVDPDASTDQPTSSTALADSSPAPTSTALTDSITATSTSLAPSTSAASTTIATTPETPETTETSEPAVESSLYADGQYLGTAEYTEWGDVQVQVTISNGALVEVTALHYPTDRKSSSINNQALPILEANAVAVQSADLDIVSGATYTSRTYADSLQAALDQAALASVQEASTP